MNSHIVEKTMHSIKNIDRLTDLAAIDVYNTTHDTINKYEIMKEHATEEYTNESFYQESVLAGVLIGAGILGVAVSAFFIIKKIIDSKSQVTTKNSDGSTSVAVDLSDPKSTEKFIAKLKERASKLNADTKVTTSQSINPEAAEKEIAILEEVVQQFQEIIDNKDDTAKIKSILSGLKTDTDFNQLTNQAFVSGNKEITLGNYIEELGIGEMVNFSKKINELKTKCDKAEKTINGMKANKETDSSTEGINDAEIKSLKDFSTIVAKALDSMLNKSNAICSSANTILNQAEEDAKKPKEEAKPETSEAEKKDEEAKPTTGTGSDIPQNANPQAQPGEAATPGVQNPGQDMPPSSTPKNLDYQASGFNGGKPAESAGQPAPAANPQAAVGTGGKTPTPGSSDQPAESNMDTNFMNMMNGQQQRQKNENLTQQFGSNPAKENTNAENWINATEANDAAAEAEKQTVKTSEKSEPKNPETTPASTDQTSSDDEKITKLANELYRAPTDDDKREILGDLNRLREGESSVITYLNDVKTSLLERLKNGQDDSPSMSQAILDRIIYNYEATAKEFGINADYLNSYDKNISNEASVDNDADKSKPENENKEKSKPTASDFENFKNPEVNPESQQRFNSEINNADKSSTQSVQSDEAALKQAALNRQAEEEMRNKQQIQNRFNAEINGSNTNPSVQSDEAALKQAALKRNAAEAAAQQQQIQNRFNAEINGSNNNPSVQSDEAALKQAALNRQAEEEMRNKQQAAREAEAREVNKYQPNINGTLSSNSEENKAAQWIANAQSHDQEGDSSSNLGTNFLNAVRNGKAKMDEQPSTEASNSSEQKSELSTTEEPKTSEAPAAPETSGRLIPSALSQDMVETIRNSIVHEFTVRNYPSTFAEQLADIIIDKYDGDVVKYAIDGYNNAKGKNAQQIKTNKGKIYNRAIILANIFNIPEDEIPKPDEKIEMTNTEQQNSGTDDINMAKEDIAKEQSNSTKDDEERAAQWIANAKANGGSQNTQHTTQSVQDQNEETAPTLGTNFLNAVRNGKAKMDEQPVQPQPEASQDATNPGPDDEERAAQWIANAKANEVPETPATPAVDSTNNEFNYGANWLNSMQQARKENEINNNINYLRDEGYNNDQIRDLLANQGYDRNDVNTVLNMSDDQLKAIQDAINNNNADTITSQDHDAVPAPPQLPKKLPLEPETHINLDAAAQANEVPAGVNQVNINDAEETAKNNYLNTKIAKNPKLGYPSLEALNNAIDELIAMIKQNVAIGNDPSQYAVGVLHNIYNIASAKNKIALPSDKLAALKAVKQYIKYRMIKQGVGNYFAEMTENDIGYYNLIQEYKIEIIREEKLKLIQEQQTDPEE